MAFDESINLYLVSGNDETQIAAEAAKLVRAAAGPDADAFGLDIVREQESVPAAETINQLVRSILSPPFMGGRKTVWLQNFANFAAEGAKDDRSAEAVAFRALCEILAKGLPRDIVLVMSGPDADGRRALARTCKDKGRLVVLNKPVVRGDSWKADMQALIETAAHDKGASLPPAVAAHLVDVLGTDTARIDAELEKLICFCGGPGEPITIDAALDLCTGDGETAFWALNEAIGKRHIQEALNLIERLVRQGKDADRTVRGLLAQAATHFGHMLQIRVFMHRLTLRGANDIQGALKGLDETRRGACIEDGLEVVTFHPYRATMLAQQAMRYSGQELIEALKLARDAARQCNSSSVDERIILETLLVTIVPKRQPARRGA